MAAIVVAWVQLSGEATAWGPRLLGMALLLAAAGALWWSDRAPVAVLVATAVAAVAYHGAGGPPGPEPVPFVVALIDDLVEGGHQPQTVVADVPGRFLVGSRARGIRHGQ